MVKPLYYWSFLPVTVLAALCTDTKISFKFVCIGNSVEVFQNVASTILKSEYILYKIFETKSETIATWVMQNFSTNATINTNYVQKVALENGTILLQDFQASDEATYRMMIYSFMTNASINTNYSQKVALENGTILLQDFQGSGEATYRMMLHSIKRETVQLCAHVPPTLGCKPNITQVEHFLDASLDNPEYCGTPSVSVRWMEYPGVVHINKSRIEIQPGNETGTYRACIEGDNLNCVKNSSLQDNCENITLPSSRGNTDLKTNTNVIVAIVSSVLVCVIVVIAILIKRFCKRLKDLVSGLCAGGIIKCSPYFVFGFIITASLIT